MLKKNIFSLLVALIILYLSLANSHTFDSVPLINIPYFDKFVHFGMYFGLMSTIILEHRKTLNKPSVLLLSGLIPLFYGILIEILQATITVTRSGSFYDALADCGGILFSIFLWLLIKPRIENAFR
jgi:VanZ family protein